jgi:hypothetical protein
MRNIRHDLILTEYPQEFVESIKTPARSNYASSDIIYQGAVIISYVNAVSNGCIGNHFNISDIFQAKHTLHGTMVKTGPVRDPSDETV